jgi:hypothetical protein
MVTLLVIMAGVAVVVAGIVTALVIAVCLVVAQVTGAVRAVRGRPAPPPYAGSRPRDASGGPVAPRRANRLSAVHGVASPLGGKATLWPVSTTRRWPGRLPVVLSARTGRQGEGFRLPAEHQQPAPVRA